MKGLAMVRRILNGRNNRAGSAATRRGYTLIELIIVMAIISVLLAVAVPIYTKSIQRTKETLLKQNLFTLRNVIDEYTFDKKAAPQSLDDLVREGYLRAVPVDPIMGNEKSWRLIIEDALTSVDQTQPGIFDVRSGSDQKSLEGTPYSEW
jgi:general secretion pathway protein G